MVKYLVIPGPVVSQTDGQIHWVSGSMLIHLYGVPSHECVIQSDGEQNRAWAAQQLLVLHPQPDGNYTLPARAGDPQCPHVAC